MTITYPWPRLLVGYLLTLMIAGCASPQPVTYYNLTPVAPEHREPGPGGSAGRLAIGVGPVSLPEGLGRAQIASRLDAERLHFADAHRWSGHLAEEFAQVLTEDIAARLPAEATVALFPWGGYFRPSRRVVVTVTRFDGAPNGEAVLMARWTITDGSGKEALVSRQSTIAVKVAGDRYQDLVHAQSRALADLASAVVAALAPAPAANP